jgi:hypothetical protein
MKQPLQYTLYSIQYTGIFLSSRDFFQEKQPYVLPESPLSKCEGGTTPLTPFYLADKVEMNFNTF